MTENNKEDCYFRGVDLFASGKHDEAITAYEEALAMDPNYTDALHGLAQSYAAKGELDRAIETARRIAQIDPDDVLAQTSLSIFYQKKGMIPEAEAAAAQARVLGWKQQLREKQSSQL